jgi:hypothetical protein
MEVAVTRLNSNSEAVPSNQTDAKYQYQRALALSKSIMVYSNEQVKQLQAQSAIMYVTTPPVEIDYSLVTSVNAQQKPHTPSPNSLLHP